MIGRHFRSAVACACSAACAAVGCDGGGAAGSANAHPADPTVEETTTRATTPTGLFISWREHVIDDESVGGSPIRGGDGLAMADFDGDGFADIVSVHEDSDHVRLAFGTADPDRWVLVTLAEGSDVPAPEDLDVADVNGDGLPDVIVACEGGHFIYFQNPGPPSAREGRWPRVIPDVARRRGSFIRIAFADLDGDGRPEVVATNKGTDPADEGDPATQPPTAVSWFQVPSDPLDGGGWVEHELVRLRVPINAEPVDLDGDGDIDIVVGSRGESRLLWLESAGGDPPDFREHPMRLRPDPTRRDAHVTGFAMEFSDIDGDGRLDLVLAEMPKVTAATHGAVATARGTRPPALALFWARQPETPDGDWELQRIGDIAPDVIAGIRVADVNGGGWDDVLVGGYSLGPRLEDGADVTAADPIGRLAWFARTDASGRRWTRHDIARRKRGMYDQFVARDLDGDGDLDFVFTRGNSNELDGVGWLEQARTVTARRAFEPAAPERESQPLPLPPRDSRPPAASR